MNSNEIDPQEREYLKAKYIDADPVAGVDDVVNAILDAQEVVRRQGWARRMGTSVDPDRSPKMYAMVTQAHRALREAMAAGEIKYDDHADTGYPYDPDDPTDCAALIHFVGSRTVMVSKRPLPGKAERGVPYHAGLLQVYGQVYDFHRRGECQVGVADDCGVGRVGGLTNMMVLPVGAFVLVFRCCEACDREARESAEVNLKFGLIAAQAKLPPGGGTDPGSPVPPRL